MTRPATQHDHIASIWLNAPAELASPGSNLSIATAEYIALAAGASGVLLGWLSTSLRGDDPAHYCIGRPQ